MKILFSLILCLLLISCYQQGGYMKFKDGWNICWKSGCQDPKFKGEKNDR